MQAWLKVLMVPVLVFGASSFVWFLLGATAFFQRGLDIIGTVILVFAGIPVVLIIGLFISQLMKGWRPTNRVSYAGFFFGLIVLTLLSTYLFQSVNTNGWLNERIRSDSIKITADEKYEYRIDLINVFQRNSFARLYLKNLSTREEKNIPIDIRTKQMVGLGIRDVNHWVILEPADGLHQYTLTTTRELGIPIEKFEINVNTGYVKRLE